MLIFGINPGSTSTKVALIRAVPGKQDCELTVLATKSIAHNAVFLNRCVSLEEQLSYRRQVISDYVVRKQIDFARVDAFVGRGGGLMPIPGGVYVVTELMEEHALSGKNGIQHPANLGCVIARQLGTYWGKPAFTVNPPDVDELQDIARVTGVRGVERHVHLHALNIKETVIRHAKQHGEDYRNENYIVCHLGGGISVSAHCQGRMIDGFDIAGGEGPMTPNRCGSLAVAEVLYLLKRDGAEKLQEYCIKSGGFVSHLGTSDARAVCRQAEEGNLCAQQIWDAMIYQIEKSIGAMSAVLHGQVQSILLGGGMVYNKKLVVKIREHCSYIAPVFAYPGEFEMEAMAAGVFRAISGEEEILQYHG